jgi:hypothetical protein
MIKLQEVLDKKQDGNSLPKKQQNFSVIIFNSYQENNSTNNKFDYLYRGFKVTVY